LVHVEFLVGTKNINFIKYQLFNIPANGPSDFREDFNNGDDNSSPDQKGQKSQKKGSNGSYLSHTCVPRNVKSLYFSSVYTSGLYSNVLPYFQQYKVQIIGPGKVGKF
jgi:hypothetical protein